MPRAQQATKTSVTDIVSTLTTLKASKKCREVILTAHLKFTLETKVSLQQNTVRLYCGGGKRDGRKREWKERGGRSGEERGGRQGGERRDY